MNKQTGIDYLRDDSSASSGRWKKRCRRSGRIFMVLSLLALAAGIAARIYGAWLYALYDNMDYAVVVLMVRHIVEGMEYPVFFYGQAYMGSLEPFVSAALCFIFEYNPFVVCLGTALVASLVLLEVWRLCRRVSGYIASFIAVSLCAIGPFIYFHYMASPRGGYALCLLLTVLLVREGVFLGDSRTPSGRRESLGFFRAGLLVGLGFWNFWLVAPAVAAAGLMILSRVRLRVFRLPVWASAGCGFALGSLPWWVWNIRNSWDSLGSGYVAAPTLAKSVSTAKTLLSQRLFQVMGFGLDGWVAKATPAMVLFLLVLPLLALAFSSRLRSRSRQYRLTAFTILYSALLFVFHVFSEFGTYNTPRYLLPLLPLWAIWIGCGIGSLVRTWQGADSPRSAPKWMRVTAAAGTVLGIAAICALVVFGCLSLKAHREKANSSRTLYEASQELVTYPSSSHAMYGEFIHFGVNWATEEKACLVSPKLFRHHPYLVKLENEKSPGVFANMEMFTHFLASTATEAEIATVGKYSYIYDAVAPRFLAVPIPADEIESVVDGRGRDFVDKLLDSNGESYVSLVANETGTDCHLLIKFKHPLNVVGLRAIVRDENPLAYSQVLGRYGDSAEWRELSPSSEQRGWYWSGPRFYASGLSRRTEIVFKEEAEVAELCVKLKAWKSGAGIYVETLQVMAAGPSRESVDVAAVAEVLRGSGVKRVFADRWYANELDRLIGANIWTSRDTCITGEDPILTVTVPPVNSTAVVVLEGEAKRTASVFADAGVEVSESRVGGMAIFRPVPEVVSSASEATLCFYGGQLMCNRPMDIGAELMPGTAASFPRLGLKLLGLMPVECDNGAATISMIWEKDGGTAVEGNAFIFLHALDAEGKTAFQTDTVFARNTRPFPTASPSRWRTTYVIEPLPDTPPGEYNLAMGLWRPGLFSKRFEVESEDAPVDKRRILLPVKIKVAD